MTATTKAPVVAKHWLSGFCSPGNPPDSHGRCQRLYTWHLGPCCCTCHDEPEPDMPEEIPVPVLPEEAGLVWAGQSVDQIRHRWVTGDPFAADCGEHRVRAGRDHAVLEALRTARADVAYLLRVIDQRDT